jgi:hypothetical protein
MTNLNTEDQQNTIKSNNSGTYRFVPHSEIKIFEDTGWKVVSRMEGSHHAQYSVIMKKQCNPQD